MSKLKLIAKTYMLNNGKILALKRSATDAHRPLTWDIPGGAVDYGESPLEGAKREAVEEVGATLTNLELLDVVSEVYPEKQVITVLYKAEVSDTTIKLSPEHDEHSWLPREEFIKLDMPIKYINAAKII